MTLEAKDQLKNSTMFLSEPERRFSKLPRYKKSGLIPGWDEVVFKYQLSAFSPAELRLFRNYYHAQRKIAEGSTKRASRIFKALDHNPDFQKLENGEGTLLHNIASFVRGPVEKQRSKK